MNAWRLIGLVIVVALGLGAVPSQANEPEAESRREADRGTPSCPPGTAKVTLLASDFEGEWPGDWHVADDHYSPSCSWRQLSDENRTGGMGNFAQAGGSCLDVLVDSYLVSPPFDLSGSQYAWLEFKHDFQVPQFGGGMLAEAGLIYATGTYIALLQMTTSRAGPATEVLDLPSEYYQADRRIVFRHGHAAAPYSGDAWWQVDEVRVYSCEELTSRYLPFVERKAP